ncbi:unnamed protein product [Symbiodinium natans]|uniref:Uncharacterized protein n=1 Tax=Symbiodinium natans TaxID=878477 RepID=A0A812PCP1_9DINO|nr:unnamed protein product [Symbiodinium natans]
MEGIDQIWSKFTFVLGFLIVFRSNQAYSRFWESVTLFHQISGEWMSAFSNLLSFCSADPVKQAAVAEFRQYLIRLMSLLHCNALQTLCELDDDRLEVVDLGGICRTSLVHLKGSPDRCETVLLWLERFIIEADKSKTLDVPAPILSRAFQELSRGMVGVTNVRKIRDVPFPFPYSQFLSFILVVHWLVTPIVASQIILKPWWAGIMVFAVSTSYWTLYYIAQEIDQPFGEDANDLPVREMQRHFNEKLEFFISPLSCSVPEFNLDASQHIQMLSSTFSVALASSVESPVEASGSLPEASAPLSAVQKDVESSACDLMDEKLAVARRMHLDTAKLEKHEIIEVTLANVPNSGRHHAPAPGRCDCTAAPEEQHATICLGPQAPFSRKLSEVSVFPPAAGIREGASGESAPGLAVEDIKQLLSMLPGEQDTTQLAKVLQVALAVDLDGQVLGATKAHPDPLALLTMLSGKLDALMASDELRGFDSEHQQKLRLLSQRLRERLSRMRRV